MGEAAGELDGKVALVTGGARGLGEGMALELARQGAAVAILDVLDEAGRALAGRIEAAGGRALHLTCDIRDADAVAAAVRSVEDAFGGLTTLVNNAAVNLPAAPITQVSDAAIANVLDVNVIGALRFCAATFEGMRARGGGSVINLASVHQSHSLAGWTAYAASKGAIVSMTRQLAVEWGPHGIRVNSVSPGAIDATMTRDILDADETGTLELRFRGMHALARLGRVEEVAKTVAFLASDGAGFITGEDILVDGGLTKLARL